MLLINPDIVLPAPLTSAPGVTYGNAISWLAASDVSARIEEVVSGSTVTGYNLVPNSLQDLANRANRVARRHTVAAGGFYRFPYFMNRGTLDATRSADFDAAGTLSLNGNDIVLTDVAGFDIKTWSPDAFVIPNSGILLQPSSPGYAVRYQTNTNIPYSCSSSVTNGPVSYTHLTLPTKA